MCFRHSIQTIALLLFVLLLISNNVSKAEDELQLGTTLVALKFQNGVVLAADTRTSVSTFVSNRFAEKLEKITNCLSIARSGSAADTQELARKIRDGVVHPMFCKYGKHLTTSEVAHWLRQAILKDKGEMSVGLLLAGCDPNGSSEIFSLTQTGALLRENGVYAAGGSGSVYVMGYLDERLKDPGDISEGEAVELCQKAIETAILRDGSSGGMIRLHVVTAKATRIETIQASPSIQREVDSVPGFAQRVSLAVPTVNKRKSFVP